MKAYWFDNLPGDQREPHDSGRPVSPETLQQLGIIYKHCPTVADVDAIASERSYKNRDEITVSPKTMGDVYEEKVKNFGSDTPIGRAGQPAELAPVYVLLASDQGSYISAARIGVTGGRPIL